MPSTSNKKLLILYVLEVLREYSDEEHPLKQEEIAQKIFSSHGMECERKAIAANIGYLEDYGLDIVRVKNKGVYLGSRALEPSEITFLVDAIFSNRTIDGKYSQQLAEKLYNCLSLHKRKRYKYIYKTTEIAKSHNKEVFFNIDEIQAAIDVGKKVEFHYKGYNVSKGETDIWRRVSPYFLFNSQGKYYLVCSIGPNYGLANYKVERMTDVRLTDTSVDPITAIKGCEKGLDIAKYVNENIYAFTGNSVTATLQLFDDGAYNAVIEWFGENVRTYINDGKTYAEVRVNELALIYWALQYGHGVEVLAPQSTRDKIKSAVFKLAEKYK